MCENPRLVPLESFARVNSSRSCGDQIEVSNTETRPQRESCETRQAPAAFAHRALDPLCAALEQSFAVSAQGETLCVAASCALRCARDLATWQLPYARRSAREALFAASPRLVALAMARYCSLSHDDDLEDEEEERTADDLQVSLELIERLLCDDFVGGEARDEEEQSKDNALTESVSGSEAALLALRHAYIAARSPFHRYAMEQFYDVRCFESGFETGFRGCSSRVYDVWRVWFWIRHRTRARVFF